MKININKKTIIGLMIVSGAITIIGLLIEGYKGIISQVGFTIFGFFGLLYLLDREVTKKQSIISTYKT